MGALASERGAEAHHDGLGHDQAFGDIEIGAHTGRIDLQAADHETGLCQRAGRQ